MKNIKKEDRIIENPTLNILAATTPEWLQIKEADVLGGFLGRFLPIYTGTYMKRLAIREKLDEDTLSSLIADLRGIALLSGEYEWEDEAKGIFIKSYDKIWDDFENEDNKPLIQPYWSRIDTHIRKLAMIFDACSPQHTFSITKEHLERAMGFMDLITGGYKELLSSLSFSWSAAKEKQFLNLVSENKSLGITRSDAMRRLHLDKWNMDRLVNTLIEKDQIVEREEARGRKRGKVYYPPLLAPKTQ